MMIYQSELLIELRRALVDDYVRMAHLRASLIESTVEGDVEKLLILDREVLLVEDDLSRHLDDLETVARANHTSLSE